MTDATPDYAGLAQKLHYRVENPSAWSEGFDQEASDLMEEAASALRTLLENNAALERERDELKHDIERYVAISSEEATRAEAADARVKELEAEAARRAVFQANGGFRDA